MNDFLNSFVQAPDGSWTCVRSCHEKLHTGTVSIKAGARFTRGQLVSGIDIASVLDHRSAFAAGD